MQSSSAGSRGSLRGAGLLLCGLLSCLGAGCPATGAGGPQQATTFSGAKRPELSCAREGAERVDVGSWRGTGRPDVARVYVAGAKTGGQAVLSCREVDLNGDGHKDVLVYFDPEGHKQREEFDHDYDGIADVKSFYEAGRLVRQELDLNHDGKADVVQYFEGGKLLRTERVGLPADAPAAAPPAAKPTSPPP